VSPQPEHAGETGELGHPRLHLRRTDSTNERARRLALAGAPHGTLVTATEQTAGRGRQGRRWSAPPGSSLLMSLVLRERHPSGAAACPDRRSLELLPLAAAVAVCDVAGADARIKWPNDVVFERSAVGIRPALAKVAGILIEGRPQQGWAVLGIGINAAVSVAELPPELHVGAATLGLSRREIEPLLTRLLDAIGRRLDESALEILVAWRARDALRGRTVSWAGGSGRAEDIDGEGRLVVALPEGGHTALGAGEVHLADVG
jgi:BirA family transcriptional regulator, biotin operon repressor / biotin---[acetyl-CoA-carboxylase] ligase